MKKNLIIAAVLIFLLGFWFWRSRDEQVIKRQCKSLIGMVDSVDDGVGMLDASRLERLLASQVLLHIESIESEPFKAGNIEVVSGYQWLAGKVRTSEFKISEFKAILISGDKAEVQSEVEGMLEMPDMRMYDGTYTCNFTWEKDEAGDWLLTRFEFLDCAQ